MQGHTWPYYATVIAFLLGYGIGYLYREDIIINCTGTHHHDTYGSKRSFTTLFAQDSNCESSNHVMNKELTCESSPEIPMKTQLTVRDYSSQKNVITEVFNTIHHPELASNEETYLSQAESMSEQDPLASCDHVYMTRTGSKTEMSVKCLAVIQLEASKIGKSILSHRYGTSAKLVDQYQQDYTEKENREEEAELLPLMLNNREKLIARFRDLLGPPIDPVSKIRKTAILMVANEGVMDLILNFLCSCQQANINLAHIVVILGQPELIPLIEDMGAHAMFDDAFGPIPKNAAGNYGDGVFGRLMWLKATSIYTAAYAGYNVLFQDADLIWLKDPTPFLQSGSTDIVFMDDGARTPRFSPFFVNSGFYFQLYNERTLYLMELMLKSVSEISATHSHQATLTRHITEAHHLSGLSLSVLEREMFPSGIMYHHDKPYIRKVLNYEVHPYVWHMCWTSSREDKVKYFKEMGFWFIDDSLAECYEGKAMQDYFAHNSYSGEGHQSAIRNHCCKLGNYWEQFPQDQKLEPQK